MESSFIYGIGDEVILSTGVLVLILIGMLKFSQYLPHFMWTENNTNDATHANVGNTYNSEICPICIGPHRLAVETNCGHKFCGMCITEYYRLRAPRNVLFSDGALECPMCRQKISLFLINFSRPDIENFAAQRIEVEAAVHEYNVCHGGGPRSWTAYIRDCPVLARHLFSNFFSLSGLVFIFRLRVIACFAAAIMYLLLPLDIIPEAIFGFVGLLDDFFIVFLCAMYLTIIYRRYLVSQANDAGLLLE